MIDSSFQIHIFLFILLLYVAELISHVWGILYGVSSLWMDGGRGFYDVMLNGVFECNLDSAFLLKRIYNKRLIGDIRDDGVVILTSSLCVRFYWVEFNWMFYMSYKTFSIFLALMAKWCLWLEVLFNGI